MEHEHDEDRLAPHEQEILDAAIGSSVIDELAGGEIDIAGMSDEDAYSMLDRALAENPELTERAIEAACGGNL